jgi:hypothetical protein
MSSSSTGTIFGINSTIVTSGYPLNYKMGKFYSNGSEPTIIIDFGWLSNVIAFLYPITLMPSWVNLVVHVNVLQAII